MTLELTIIGVLTGIGLGLRYKVMILVPAITLALLFAMIVGIARADHVGSIVLTMVILGSAVQLGYLAGVAIHAAAAPICASLIAGRNPALNSEIGRT